MGKYFIAETRKIDNREFVHPTTHEYDDVQDALDYLYVMAKRRGAELKVDNSVSAAFGFCIWQLYFEYNGCKYNIYSEYFLS